MSDLVGWIPIATCLLNGWAIYCQRKAIQILMRRINFLRDRVEGLEEANSMIYAPSKGKFLLQVERREPGDDAPGFFG